MHCAYYAHRLLDALTRYIRGTRCDCVALSGGIDTSLVALAARLAGLRPRAVTVYNPLGLPRDLYYAVIVARRLGITEHTLLPIDPRDTPRLARIAAKCTRRTDHIEVRNDIVFLRALEWAREKCNCIYTGDGGDELLAGYTYLALLPEKRLREEQLRLGVRGRYPTLELAECIGVEAHAPLLNDEALEILLEAPIHCIRGPSLESKHLARLLLEVHGLHEVATRPKTPAEAGAGTDTLTERDVEKLLAAPQNKPHQDARLNAKS